MSDEARLWGSRIEKATEYHEKWWRQFRVDESIRYYEGNQWPTKEERRYVVNYIYSTIEVKLPALLFSEPYFKILPKVHKMDADIETASAKARLWEAALNTWIQDPDNYFSEEIEMALLDAFFAFGLIEVGFSGSFIKNPNIEKPVVAADFDTDKIETGEVLSDFSDLVPEWEKVYARRINPMRFRVGAFDSFILSRANWCGYYDYFRSEDLLSEFGTSILSGGGVSYRMDEFQKTSRSPELDALLRAGDIKPVWKIWDLRSKRFLILIDGMDEIAHEQNFSNFPLFPITYHYRTSGFYPIPPVFNWIPMQDEQNDIKEAARLHRKRFKRILVADRTKIQEEEELQKLTHGPDGTVVQSNGPANEAVGAVPATPMDSAVQFTLVATKDDFNRVAGVSEEQQGIADRQTATQTIEIAKRSNIREAKPKVKITKWLKRIAIEIINIQSKLTLPFWIKTSVDSGQMLQEAQETQYIWEQITGTELGDIDFELDIVPGTMSPIDKEEDKRKFFEFLAILTRYPHLSLSPFLIREAANLIGYKNETAIRHFQQMATLAMLGLQQQAGGNPMAEQTVNSQTPPTTEEIRQQLDQQLRS